MYSVFIFDSFFLLLLWFRYTSKMLLSAIDEHCKGTYDFLYLPIDFKASRRPYKKVLFYRHELLVFAISILSNLTLSFQNKCNVGYAFINLIEPEKIVPFYKVQSSIAAFTYRFWSFGRALVKSFKKTTFTGI